jgi:acyl-coenzyme A synthetase/AMP-(fatty) acid ligase
MEAFPGKKFYNAYGPTEATGISTCYHVQNIPQDPMERIPIGQPCAETQVYVLKEDGTLALAGETGELCISGSGLSRGYWNDETKTKNAFVQNPLSSIPGDRIYRTGDLALLNKEGNYELVGRKDNQVKNMGYRIDLAEIENGLISTGKIKDAAVVLKWSEKFDVNELVAVVVADSNSSWNNLRERLKNIIPAYMMPHQILVVDQIPRNDRGKIDRKRISETLSQL